MPRKGANKTGSHLFTHSLISNCVNVEGAKGRDNELMFGISQAGKTDLFVGRRVSTEKIEEVKGRELSDEEINENKNTLVRDNIVCTDCENLFGKVEGPFAHTLKEIRENKLLKIKENIFLRLYFIIQAWRASVSNYNGWKLSSNFEERLRNIIYKGCSQIEDGIDQDVIDELVSIPMIVTYMETKAGCETTNVVLIPNNKAPYLLLLCDFVLQLFEYTDTVDGLRPADFFNLNTVEAHKPINYREDQFLVGFMSNVERMYLIRKINSDMMAGAALEGFVKQFIAYCRAYGSEVTPRMIQTFVELLVNEKDIPLALRYSDERIKLLAKKLTGN